MNSSLLVPKDRPSIISGFEHSLPHLTHNVLILQIREERFKKWKEFPKIILQVCNSCIGKMRGYLIFRLDYNLGESLLLKKRCRLASKDEDLDKHRVRAGWNYSDNFTSIYKHISEIQRKETRCEKVQNAKCKTCKNANFWLHIGSECSFNSTILILHSRAPPSMYFQWIINAQCNIYGHSSQSGEWLVDKAFVCKEPLNIENTEPLNRTSELKLL